MSETSGLRGPDLGKGISLDQLPDGAITMGHFEGEAVVIVRRGDEVLAIGGSCTHYGAPLDQGLVIKDTVRCPWHHSRFSLRDGDAVAAPALNPVAPYGVVRDGNTVRIVRKLGMASRPRPASSPSSVVIIGTGAAGSAAADMLRRQGYEGKITMVGDDSDPPYDRPNLSKDYLAGTAPEDWIPLRPAAFYREQGIDLRIGATVTQINVGGKDVVLRDGQVLPYDFLLIATGAQPRRLSIPGAGQNHVFTLRSLVDSKALIDRAKTTERAVIIGAGFIGLEVAAALRTRNLAVDVVAPDARPLEHALGPQLGDMLRKVHESHGVVFHLGNGVAAIEEDHVVLSDGKHIPAGMVVVGAGVEPRTALAASAGLELARRGVKVDAYLETSVKGIFAAGDVACWPEPRSGELARVEHWVVAQRQGQTVARNMLGAREPFTAVPFFWTAHYDVVVSYVGHAPSWDRTVVDGDPDKHDCRVEYWKGKSRLAVATVGRDRDSLMAEADMEAVGS